MALEPGTVRADDAPAELNAPGGAVAGFAPPPIPAETQGTAPPEFTATGEPDLSEDGLAAAAEKAAADKAAAAKPTKKPAKAKADPPAPAALAPAPDPAAKPAEDAPADPATPTDEEAAAAAKPAEEPEGKIATQLRSREKKLVSQQTAFARERTEFESFKKASEAQLTQQTAQLRSQWEQAKPRIEQAEKVLDLVRQDPLALLRGVGWTDEQIGQRLLNGNKPGAEEVQSRAERELQSMREQIAADRAAIKRDREDAARERAEAKAAEEKRSLEAAEKATVQTYLATARAGTDRWPLASRIADARLQREGLRIATEHAAQSIALTDEEILDKLEDDLSEVVTISTKAKGGKTPSAATPVPRSGKAAASPQASSGTPRSQPAPTLTSEAAGERSSDLEDFDPLTATPEETLAATLAEIEREKVRRSTNGADSRR